MLEYPEYLQQLNLIISFIRSMLEYPEYLQQLNIGLFNSLAQCLNILNICNS